MKNKYNNHIINYKDRLFRAIGCLMAAHVVVMMGRPDLSTFQALTIRVYYPTLLINYIIALIVAMAVKKVTIALDKQHEWYRDIWRRALLQLVFGVMAVSILSFFLVWAYFHTFEKDLITSGYLDYELPFSIALITILNLYYVAYYFYTYPRTVQEEMPDKQRMLSDKDSREILVVDTAARSIALQVRDVIMFFIYDRITFIRTSEMESLNDCLQSSMPLSDIMELLDEKTFFRINRKCIINFNTIDSFRPWGRKSLLITLKSEYNKIENIQGEEWEKLITVSGDKVSEFRSWMNR